MIGVVMAACVLAAAFFAGMETGLLSADQLGLYLKKQRGVGYARAADFLLLKPERLLATTLIGTNIAIVTAAIMFTATLREAGLWSSSWLGGLLLSFVLLIFTEVVPKSFLRRHADTVAVRMAPILLAFYFVLLPLAFVLNTIVKALILVGGRAQSRSRVPQSRDDLRLLVRLGTRESGLGREERRVVEDIFDFRDTLAREVMIQIHEHPVCPVDASPLEAVRLAYEGGARFLPVFRERADNVVGYIDVERLLLEKPEGRTVESVVQQPVFYPDVKRIPDLLLAMNRRKLDVVFLSDEYGAVSGLITPAEIAAEIVGFIPGEQLPVEREIEALGPGHFLVAGTADIEDVAHETGIHLKKRHYDTVGGFLLEQLGEIPQVGATLEQGGLVYKVVDRDERHITRIEILRKGYDTAKKKD